MKNLTTSRFNRIMKAVRQYFTHHTYYATVAICGTTIKFPIEAPDYRRAKEEAEYFCDDVGYLVDLVESDT